MGSNEYSVVAENISKCYKMYKGPKEKLLDLLSPKGAGKDFYALKDLSFKVKKGDVVGLLGLNGAGKSTLSNILGGVSLPTKGEIKIEGEASVIAIGIGLNNFLTGMENIEVKSLMMGYKSSEIEKIKEEVINFADIGDFINQPIRTYSSGMRSRLGFAISIHTNPDILVIDEALSVGDPTFTQKCLVKMNEFKDSGRTIFFVSHSIEQVRKFCNKALWLEYGVLREYGDVEKVASNYDAYIKTMNTMNDYEKKFYKRMILENQEHSLLNEFVVISQKMKKVYPNGKLIKFVTLVNKDIKTKVIAYNFDFYTFIFGPIPSLLRKKVEMSIMILACQIFAFFIVPYPYSILSNFLVNFIWALFTGKLYVSYLIDKQNYIGYEVWDKNYKDVDKKEKHIIKIKKDVIKQKRRFKALILTIGLTITIVMFGHDIQTMYKNKFGTTKQSQNINLQGDNLIIICNGEKISSLNILNKQEDSEQLELKDFNGKIQVQNNEVYDELSNVVKASEIEKLKAIIKSNFDITINNYVIMDLDNEYISKLLYGYKMELEGDNLNNNMSYNYKARNISIVKNIISIEEDDYESIKQSVNNKTSILPEKFDEFYTWIKSKKIIEDEILFTTEEVNEFTLGEIISIEDLQLINKIDKKDLKFLAKSKDELEINNIIKSLKQEVLAEKERLRVAAEQSQQAESINE